MELEVEVEKDVHYTQPQHLRGPLDASLQWSGIHNDWEEIVDSFSRNFEPFLLIQRGAKFPSTRVKILYWAGPGYDKRKAGCEN